MKKIKNALGALLLSIPMGAIAFTPLIIDNNDNQIVTQQEDQVSTQGINIAELYTVGNATMNTFYVGIDFIGNTSLFDEVQLTLSDMGGAILYDIKIPGHQMNYKKTEY
jgi:hypothetical protein